MASKYETVDPQAEKLKRLYNCSSIQEDDLKYLNYQFERYKTRNFHVVSITGFLFFGVSALVRRVNTSPFKYYVTCLGVSYGFYQFMVMKNNQHIEQIVNPYFEKYKVK